MGAWKDFKDWLLQDDEYEEKPEPLITEEQEAHQEEAQKEADEIAWELDDEDRYDFSQEDELDFDFTPDEKQEKNDLDSTELQFDR